MTHVSWSLQQFSEVMTALYEYVDEASGRTSRLIDDKVYNVIIKNKVWILSLCESCGSRFRKFERKL
jgi:hypothetical protein